MSSIAVIRRSRQFSIALESNKKCKCIHSKIFNIKAIRATRCLMLAQMALVIYFAVCVERNYTSIFGVFASLVIVAETLYLCIKNDGRDLYWYENGAHFDKSKAQKFGFLSFLCRFSLSYLSYSAFFISICWHLTAKIHISKGSCLTHIKSSEDVSILQIERCFNVNLTDESSDYNLFSIGQFFHFEAKHR